MSAAFHKAPGLVEGTDPEQLQECGGSLKLAQGLVTSLSHGCCSALGWAKEEVKTDTPASVLEEMRCK